MNENIENKIGRIKELLNKLVKKGELDYALEVINKCDNVIKNDADIISIKGIIYYAKNEIEKAEEIFKKGLLVDSTYADFYYNLGCVYELKEEYEKAAKFFARALEFVTGEETIEIGRKLNNILYKISTPLKDETKIAFFVKPGLDSFLNDIILGLMDEYFVRKIVVTDFKQIDEGMQWADICWFEWCDELVIYGSRHELAREKKIICRIHRYEAFTNYIFQVEWENVDKVIFVASHILNIVNSKLGGKIREKSIIIPNSINLQKYNFRDRKKGFNIAYVGYLNYRKSPNMLLQLIGKLTQIDKRYRLFIAGEFQDEENMTYFEYLTKEMGLNDYVIFEGWQKDINTWLEDKDYILSCSIFEGHPVGIMEGMAKGIKPVIHNFVGARDIYPKEWLWNSINEAVSMIIEEKYNSIEYRRFVENNYGYDKQLNEIIKVISEVNVVGIPSFIANKLQNSIKTTDEEIKKYYNNFSSYLKRDRERENPRHLYIKNRLKELIKPYYSVLDCGCGIGIISEYIKNMGVKEVIGIDISHENINYACETIKDVIFLEGDIVEINLNKKFDVILMIDVLEHIPLEKYPQLFCNLKRHLKESGYVYMSIPTFEYNEFIRTYRPELLQIIDNSISMEMMVELCKYAKLKILFYNTYGIDVPFQYNEYIIINEPQYEQLWSNLIPQF
ncbi:Methyltransferase type 11 [Caldicellulosiruptor saccharolyticus DSM 8903]|uniref:Methyltransferase type 11 n=1 Tax=Caldicellulosiruptor saccharolyticus (strain ATCC 43494 / DSM 8903 / Tp8T 6331) TaxID=351627 RepID=A4XK37_CALS8|nr:methyltransferase domain-containing protein [Caldicellulosiruptor saccharolyticus]ABP67272.1 Methyltransferase type 11 [Caldicellulosiruptor saccharolyticus DSM 8903]